MKNKFPGYYRPTEEHFNIMLKNALIVFDTNILLDLYRVSSDTANNLMDIIRKLDKRLWIPYQVAKEYHNDLFSVISGQIKKYKESEETISTICKQLAEKRNHPFLSEDLHKKSMSLFNELQLFFDEQKQKLVNIVMEESIKEELCNLLDGKVGDGFDTKELEDIYKEGTVRYPSKIPPGYMDTKNKQGNDIYGDLIVWKEILKKARDEHRDVLFITDDVKEDWFLRFDGNTYGPHPLLIQEFKNVTGQNIYIYTLDRFLGQAEKMEFSVNADTIKEIEQRKTFTLETDDCTLLNSFLNKGESLQSFDIDESLNEGSLDSTYKYIYETLSKNVGKTKISVVSSDDECENDAKDETDLVGNTSN